MSAPGIVSAGAARANLCSAPPADISKEKKKKEHILNVSPFSPARSERYHHLETEEEDTNDEDFNVELRQFSSCSHRFSKVRACARVHEPARPC